MSAIDSCEEFELLVKSANSLVTCETVEEDRLRYIARRSALNLGLPFYEWSIVKGLAKDGQILISNTSEPSLALLTIQKHQNPGVFLLYDFASHLTDPILVRLMRETVTALRNSLSTVVLCAPQINLPMELAHLAVPIRLKFPGETELRELFKNVMEPLLQSKKSKLEISGEDINSLIQSLSGLTLRQARQILTYAAISEGALKAKDIDLIIKRKGELVHEAGVLEFFPVDNSPIQLGGLEKLKSWLTTARLGFSSEARALGLPAPKGILLVGVPGCGKSLSAKMIAKIWKQPLLRLDASRLFSKYIGDSERNFQNAMDIAEAMAPSVFWIDEIEKLFGAAGATSSGSDGGLAQRLFGSLLTWLQEKNLGVFLVATANNLDLLPPELLRKGRFDEIFFVDLPTEKERLEILSVQLSHRKQDQKQFDLPALASATKGYSGAELEQIIISALLKTLARKSQLKDSDIIAEAQSFTPLAIARAQDIADMRTYALAHFTPAS